MSTVLTPFEKLYLCTQVAIFGAGGVALVFYAWQAKFAKQNHLSGVYRSLFQILDNTRIRNARHVVYKMIPMSAENVDSGSVRDEKYWKGSPDPDQKRAADLVARSFDQLGLLIREGAVPLNIVAHFYASPALRCWYNLQPFVGVERDNRPPNGQDGHLWEWENLVFNILIPQIDRGKGIWKGVSRHDRLETICQDIKNQQKTHHIKTDLGVYRPGRKLWVIRPWYKFWQWARPY